MFVDQHWQVGFSGLGRRASPGSLRWETRRDEPDPICRAYEAQLSQLICQMKENSISLSK